MYTLAVQRNFTGQHFLIGGDWGAENQWHSHHYRLEIQLEGATLDQHGYLVPVDDDNTMGRAIRSVLEDDSLRDKIARRGYEAFEAQFTEAQVVRQYLDFFAKVSA